MSNDDFERNAGGFVSHYKKEHNMWAYMCFFIDLSKKKRTDLTANELFVVETLGIKTSELDDHDEYEDLEIEGK